MVHDEDEQSAKHPLDSIQNDQQRVVGMYVSGKSQMGSAIPNSAEQKQLHCCIALQRERKSLSPILSTPSSFSCSTVSCATVDGYTEVINNLCGED